ncbi:hypothetical protein Q8A73_013182 [Channa argus]|nr:hypothetical protein Q8A73_013182 [Channa argus]
MEDLCKDAKTEQTQRGAHTTRAGPCPLPLDSWLFRLTEHTAVTATPLALRGVAEKAKSGVTHSTLRGTAKALEADAFVFAHFTIRGERERSPPLPQIMQSRFPHLGNSQGSAQPECNG